MHELRSTGSELTDHSSPRCLELIDRTKAMSQRDLAKGRTGVNKGVAGTKRAVTHSHQHPVTALASKVKLKYSK